MNQELKEQHLSSIIEANAIVMYHKLCAACDMREGGMLDSDQMLVADVARSEQIKQALLDDIVKRGIGTECYNGKQTYYQENKSIAQLRAYCEQQRKILSELRLTPNSRKATSVPIDDDFNTF